MIDQTNQSKSWFERLSNLLMREPNDRAQLISLLRQAEQNHILEAEALKMIEGVLLVTEMQVRDIMIPKSQMIVVNIDQSNKEILHVVIESHHSRFPVISHSKDKIDGILLAKDLLRYTFNDNEAVNLRDIIRPTIFVPESKRLNILLREFRLKHNHIAIVVDEYGGVAGLVTIEDVLEQIVGDIEDEFDIEETPPIRQLNNTQFTVKAITPIEDFNDCFKTDFSDDEFDTIGGILISKFGHLPRRGESLQLQNLHFKVLHADNRRLRLLRVTRRKN